MRWHDETRWEELIQTAEFDELISQAMIRGRIGSIVALRNSDGGSCSGEVTGCALGSLGLRLSTIEGALILLDVWASFEETVAGRKTDGSSFLRERAGRVTGRITVEVSPPELENGMRGEALPQLMNILTTLAWKATP